MFKSKRKKLEERLEFMEIRLEKTKNELLTYQKLYKEQLELNNSSNYLMEQNEKLINWIEKIINEVGIYEVSERNSISIPIYKNPYPPMYDTEFNGNRFVVERKDITIPEIRVIKQKIKVREEI
jgi:hypothetical protein